MQRNAFIFIAVLLAVAFSGAAQAAKRVALVIGNSAYQNATPLKNPLNDATDVAARFRSLQFDVVEGIDLDMDDMRRTVREFVSKTEGAELAVFFYAGHGLQVNGSNYLVPVDANLSSVTDLQFETMPVDFILGPMEVNAKTSLVFLDACRDNPLARSLARSMGTRSSAIGTGLAEIGGGIGTLISYATQPGNVALDGEGRNSPFTTALLTHLGKPGAGITGTMTAVRRDVLASTKGKQVPWEHSSLTGIVVLKPAAIQPEPPAPGAGTAKDDPGGDPRPRPGSTDIELTLWRAVETSDDPALFEDYLKRFPDGVFSAVARSRIAILRKPPDAAPQQPGSPNGSGITLTYSVENHCDGDGKIWFNAMVAGTSDVVTVCGDHRWLRYNFGPIGRQELVYPKAKGGSNNAFTLRQYTRPGTTRLKFEFSNGGYRYAILESLEQDGTPRTSASLQVTRISSGRVVSDLDLSVTTKPLLLMELARQVRSAPFDE
jgi:hypothetical protein